MRKLKVYGGMLINPDPQNPHHTQQGVVAAVSSQKELAELTGCSLYEIQGWWSITCNKEDVERALANPHQIIWTGRY